MRRFAADGGGRLADVLWLNALQLRIEYHPRSDGANAKIPDDSVTVDLKAHLLSTATY
jgi:hypothetical protein